MITVHLKNALAVGLMAPFLACAGTSVEARPRPLPGDQAKDGINVVSHLSLREESAGRLLTTVHWRKHYLYVELASRPVVLEIDVSDAARPAIVGELPLSKGGPDSHVDLVVGNSMLVTDSEDTAAQKTPRSVKVMNFAEAANPRVVQEFANVTGFLRDANRGLVYVFNNAGLWILRESPAPDEELQKQYEHDVLYNH
jgi:hypothetical protein